MVQYSSERNGSALSGLIIANGLRKNGWNTYVVFGYHGPMEQVYREQGHQVDVIPHKNWLRRDHPLRFLKDVIAEFKKAAQFKFFLNKTQPDLVYINTSVSLAAARAAKQLSIPTVWHLRELFGDEGGEMQAPRLSRAFVSLTFRHMASQVIANSKIVARNLLGSRYSKSASIIPNCVEDEYFETNLNAAQARSKFGLPQDKFLIGVPGTLRPAKGHSFFLDAFRDLCQQHGNVVAAITGGGNNAYAAGLRDQISQSELASRVFMLGEVQDMPGFYRACDIVCVPSQSESFGRVVIEAFASGVPVVATAVGGIVEFLKQDENGLLVKFGNAHELTLALDALIQNENVRKRLASAAQSDAKERFSVHSHNAKIQNIVRKTLAVV